MINQIVNQIKDWGKKVVNDIEVGEMYLFGSITYREGLNFTPETSDIDLIIKIPNDIKSPIERRNWIRRLKKHKEELELSLMLALRKKETDKQIISIIPVTDIEVELNIHKSGARDFFTRNKFTNVENGKEIIGIPINNNHFLSNELLIQTIENIQGKRNIYLKNSVTKDFNALLWKGDDILPKELLRDAAKIDSITRNFLVPGDEFNINFGSNYLVGKLRDAIDINDEYASIYDWVTVKSGGRGTKKNEELNGESHLLLYELLYNDAINSVRDLLQKEKKVNYFQAKGNISIKEYKRIDKFEYAEYIGNAAISPDEDQMAFSQDNELFIIELSKPLPEYLGDHDAREFDLLKVELEDNSQKAHNCKITDVTFSADGKIIISSDSFGTIKIWDPFQKRLLNIISAHFDTITSISVSPNNDFLATGSLDEDIKIWRISEISNKGVSPIKIFEKKSNIITSHRKKGPYPHELENITSIAFSPDGKYIASGDQKGLLKIIEIRTGKEVFRKKIHNSAIQNIAFSPTRPGLIATASDDTRIRIVDLEFGGVFKTLGEGKDKHTRGLSSVAFSYDGKILVSSGTDAFIKLWDINERKLLLSHRRKEAGLVDKISFFPNRFDFATNSFAKSIGLWHINDNGFIQNTVISFEERLEDGNLKENKVSNEGFTDEHIEKLLSDLDIILQLLAKNEITKGLEKLNYLEEKNYAQLNKQELLSFNNRWNKLRTDQYKGIINYDQINIEHNKLFNDMTDFVNAFKSNVKSSNFT